MKNDEMDLIEYNEDDAVKYILEYIDDQTKERVSEDEVEYVLDVIYDYYEEKGYVEEDSAEEASIDEEEMLEYILKASKKDKINLTEDDIVNILNGEYEYGKSIGVYFNED